MIADYINALNPRIEAQLAAELNEERNMGSDAFE